MYFIDFQNVQNNNSIIKETCLMLVCPDRKKLNIKIKKNQLAHKMTSKKILYFNGKLTTVHQHQQNFLTSQIPNCTVHMKQRKKYTCKLFVRSVFSIKENNIICSASKIQMVMGRVTSAISKLYSFKTFHSVKHQYHVSKNNFAFIHLPCLNLLCMMLANVPSLVHRG